VPEKKKDREKMRIRGGDRGVKLGGCGGRKSLKIAWYR